MSNNTNKKTIYKELVSLSNLAEGGNGEKYYYIKPGTKLSGEFYASLYGYVQNHLKRAEMNNSVNFINNALAFELDDLVCEVMIQLCKQERTIVSVFNALDDVNMDGRFYEVLDGLIEKTIISMISSIVNKDYI